MRRFRLNIFFASKRKKSLFSLSFALSEYEQRNLGTLVSLIYFFHFKTKKKSPYFSLIFAVSEYERRTLIVTLLQAPLYIELIIRRVGIFRELHGKTEAYLSQRRGFSMLRTLSLRVFLWKFYAIPSKQCRFSYVVFVINKFTESNLKISRDQGRLYCTLFWYGLIRHMCFLTFL